MEYFYDKQKKNIRSWHELSENSPDNYMAFMSEWIAFNAICYNLYYKKAVKERANLESTRNQLQTIRDNFNESDILNVVETKVTNHRANGCSITHHNDKWKVNINLQNSNLKLSISSNYTEDIIFNEFVNAYDEWYSENTQLSNEIFNSLKLSLKKGERNFVINMAKHNLYKEEVKKYGIYEFSINDKYRYAYLGEWDGYDYLYTLVISKWANKELTSLFGDKWIPVFKKWFEYNSGLEVREIDLENKYLHL